MDENLTVQLAYIHGRIEAQLEAYAQSLGLPAAQLTSRMGTLLLGTQNGEVMGPARGVPKLRSEAAKGGEAMEPMAVAGSPRRRASGSSKAYWAKMTPEQRSKEMQRRTKKRLATIKAKAA
jgi:hypothetical protein